MKFQKRKNMNKLDEMLTCTELGQGFKPIKNSKEMSKNLRGKNNGIFRRTFTRFQKRG